MKKRLLSLFLALAMIFSLSNALFLTADAASHTKYNTSAEAIVQAAARYIGLPYVWGGKTPAAGGFDCGGLVGYVLKHTGFEDAPGSGSASLYRYCQNKGTTVKAENVRAGDIAFFYNTYDCPDPSLPSHVGICTSNTKMIHAGDPIGYCNLSAFAGNSPVYYRLSYTGRTYCPSSHLSDVDANGWYHEAIDNMIYKGYMNGVSYKEFDLNGNITRAQAASVLYRMAGSPSVAGKTESFSDVKADSWFRNAVIWSNYYGILTGVYSQTFAPNTAMTREAFATALYKYAVHRGTYKYNSYQEKVLQAFTDSSKISNSTARTAMKWAIYNGILTGYTDKTIKPGKYVTRAEFAVMVHRYLTKFGK